MCLLNSPWKPNKRVCCGVCALQSYQVTGPGLRGILNSIASLFAYRAFLNQRFNVMNHVTDIKMVPL